MKRISSILIIVSILSPPPFVLAQESPPDPILEGIVADPLPPASGSAGAASNSQDPILTGIVAAGPATPLPAITGGMQHALGVGLCGILVLLCWITARKEGVA